MAILMIAKAHDFWFYLSGLLLVAEILGAIGYLLWISVAALIVGIFSLLLPQLPLEWQGLMFAMLTVVIAFLWSYWLRERYQEGSSNDTEKLNQRILQLIGTHATLSEAMHNGIGRITIGDSSWRVQATVNLPVGTVVEVIGVVGVTLIVRTINH